MRSTLVAICLCIFFVGLLLGALAEKRWRLADKNTSTVIPIGSSATNTVPDGHLGQRLEALESNWLTLVGILLTFSGLIMGLINLSIYFSFGAKADQILAEQKTALQDAARLKDAYKAIVDKTAGTDLYAACYKVYRAKCRRDELGGKLNTLTGLRELTETWAFLSSYLHETQEAVRHVFIREICKLDRLVLRDLKNELLAHDKLLRKFPGDIRYMTQLTTPP